MNFNNQYKINHISGKSCALQFVNLSEWNIIQTADSIYENYYETIWFAQTENVQEIKQSIMDKLNQPSVLENSIICVDFQQSSQNYNNNQVKHSKNNNNDNNNNDNNNEEVQENANISDFTVIAGYFSSDLQSYLLNNHKWSFYKHFYLIEQAVQIIVKNLNYNKLEDLQESLWGFWNFNLREDTQPEIMDIIVAKIIKQCVIKGYKRLFGFDYQSMLSRSDDDSNTMQLMPIVTYIQKAFKYTNYLNTQYNNYKNKQNNPLNDQISQNNDITNNKENNLNFQQNKIPNTDQQQENIEKEKEMQNNQNQIQNQDKYKNIKDFEKYSQKYENSKNKIENNYNLSESLDNLACCYEYYLDDCVKWVSKIQESQRKSQKNELNKLKKKSIVINNVKQIFIPKL